MCRHHTTATTVRVRNPPCAEDSHTQNPGSMECRAESQPLIMHSAVRAGMTSTWTVSFCERDRTDRSWPRKYGSVNCVYSNHDFSAVRCAAVCVATFLALKEVVSLQMKLFWGILLYDTAETSALCIIFSMCPFVTLVLVHVGVSGIEYLAPKLAISALGSWTTAVFTIQLTAVHPTYAQQYTTS